MDASESQHESSTAATSGVTVWRARCALVPETAGSLALCIVRWLLLPLRTLQRLYWRHRRRGAEVAEHSQRVRRARRALVVLGDARPRCAVCRHWDHSAGQTTLKGASNFPSDFLSPEALMNFERSFGDAEGPDETAPELEQVRGQLGIEKKIQWSDFGLCTVHGELRHDEDGCEEWG